MTTPLHFRPRSFTETIDATFHIVRARFATLATIAALMLIPAASVTLVTAVYLPQLVTPGVSETEGVIMPDLGGGLAIIFVLAIVGFLVYAFASAALVVVAAGAYHGESPDAGAAFARARSRVLPLIGVTLAKYFLATLPVVALGVFIPLLTQRMIASGGGGGIGAVVATGLLFPVVFILAVVLLVRWSITGPVTVLEETGVIASLRRSSALTRGSRLRLFALFAVLFIVFIAISATLQAIGLITGSLVVSQTMGNLASLVFYPVAAVLLTVVYHDLRIRNEGYDLELMARGLEGGDLPNAPAAPSATSRQPA